MHSLLGSLRRQRGGRHHSQGIRRTLVDVAAIKCVRDRGLDHAVEKERNLKPILNLKNLIKSEPSKSLPLNIISQKRESLGIPIRPIDFVRRYPSVFEEFFPGGIGIHPHVKLTPETLELDSEEQLIYQSDSYKQGGADRLLKLLMLAGINKIPLHIIDRLIWDLGLPQNYTQTLVPEFPDYFQVTGGSVPDPESSLELVCWSNELAVSVMEKKAMSLKTGYEKGMPIAFPLQYSRGFEMDKKFKKWVDQWQKLPYISPYENALHLPAKSDEADKWAASVLHELLHLLVPKKTERENVLILGEHMGLRSRFKRALLQHPGIFYLSSKIGTHTVVLRGGYKRTLLIEKHSLMDMRYKYIHVMNTVKEDKNPKNLQGGNNQQKNKPTCDSKGEGEEVQVDKSEDEREGELYGLSDSEVDDESDDDHDEEEDEDEDESQSHTLMNAGGNRGRNRNPKFEAKIPLKTSIANSIDGSYHRKTRKAEPTEASRRTLAHGRLSVHGRSPEGSELSRNRGRSLGGSELSRNRSELSRNRGRLPGGSELSRNRGWSPGKSEFSRNRGRSNLDSKTSA